MVASMVEAGAGTPCSGATSDRPVHSDWLSIEAEIYDCVVCGTDRPFGQPDCGDGHDDCPERFCLDCGSAILLGGVGPGDLAVGSRPGQNPAVAA